MKKIWLNIMLCVVVALVAIAVVSMINRLRQPATTTKAVVQPIQPKPTVTTIAERTAIQRQRDNQLYQSHQKWVGTPWDFYGTSQVAGEGKIACGYFVTTTLEQSGMELDRVRLAQAASETMILEVADRESVRRYSDAPLDKVLSTIRKQGEGYYIVGLDDHTGFLKVSIEGAVVFIHSGPGKGVVIERPEDSHKLSSSRYRVTGKVIW